VLTPQSVV